MIAKLRELEGRLPARRQRFLDSGSFRQSRRDCGSNWPPPAFPRSGRIGFELFDKTNFGASEFAEQVNYHRAIEGELERSVMSIREVEQARVHITMAKDSLYTEQREPAKASVLVKLRQRRRAFAAEHRRHLPVDRQRGPGPVSRSGLAGRYERQPAEPSASAMRRGRRASLRGARSNIARASNRTCKAKIAPTLEPLLGAEHFRAGVSADVDLTSGEQSEEVFDPDKSVMAHLADAREDGPALRSQRRVFPERRRTCPTPLPSPSTGSSNYARHTENITYQTSRLVKHTRLPQGTLKRLSLSILVDHTLRWDGPKRIVEAAFGREAESDPRPGGRRHRIEYRIAEINWWWRPSRSNPRSALSPSTLSEPAPAGAAADEPPALAAEAGGPEKLRGDRRHRRRRDAGL